MRFLTQTIDNKLKYKRKYKIMDMSEKDKSSVMNTLNIKHIIHQLSGIQMKTMETNTSAASWNACPQVNYLCTDN